MFGIRKKSLLDSRALSGAADRHSHLLYGVDDGVKTLEESLSILEYEASAGIETVWCTPHIMEDIPNSTSDLHDRFEDLRNCYDGPVRICLAAEYMLDALFEERLSAHDLLTMEDDVLLVEASVISPPYDFKGILARIMSEGYRPMLAHPERYRYMTERDYEGFKEMGVRFQLNVGSVCGFYGRTTADKAKGLLKHGFYDALGTDCHCYENIRRQFEEILLDETVRSMMMDIRY